MIRCDFCPLGVLSTCPHWAPPEECEDAESVLHEVEDALQRVKEGVYS